METHATLLRKCQENPRDNPSEVLVLRMLSISCIIHSGSVQNQDIPLAPNARCQATEDKQIPSLASKKHESMRRVCLKLINVGLNLCSSSGSSLGGDFSIIQCTAFPRYYR